jgi:hypothetical protein
MNVNGGAIAMGHPLGATGAMILGTVLDELERRNLNTALVTLCIGAGMGTATIDRTRLIGSCGEGTKNRASYKNFTVDIDADGIALVTWDMPGKFDERLRRKRDARTGRDHRQVTGDAASRARSSPRARTASPAART